MGINTLIPQAYRLTKGIQLSVDTEIWIVFEGDEKNNYINFQLYNDWKMKP